MFGHDASVHGIAHAAVSTLDGSFHFQGGSAGWAGWRPGAAVVAWYLWYDLVRGFFEDFRDANEDMCATLAVVVGYLLFAAF